MKIKYADRIQKTGKSFIREILKATVDPSIISFAGGLPNPISFPVDAIERASTKVLKEDGAKALQYSTTEGYLPLREYIANRYRERFNIDAKPDDILITTGSQQAIDLLSKVFINPGDDLIIEEPGYLGAIQSFSVFEPNFVTVPLTDSGVDTDALANAVKNTNANLFYAVPNFQNPSGKTYTEKTRQKVAEILKGTNILFIEDDPYGELRFMGDDLPSFNTLLPNQSILLGSFSKIVSPAMRLGWLYVPNTEIMDKLVIAKQASDLHTNYFAQRVVHQYLADNNLDEHISKIKDLYKSQRQCMVDSIKQYFPKEVQYTMPEGGMFIWVTLPEGMSSLKLFDIAIQSKVAFVPGVPFYIGRDDTNTFRLNYTNSSNERTVEGIKKLGKAIRSLMNSK